MLLRRLHFATQLSLNENITLFAIGYTHTHRIKISMCRRQFGFHYSISFANQHTIVDLQKKYRYNANQNDNISSSNSGRQFVMRDPPPHSLFSSFPTSSICTIQRAYLVASRLHFATQASLPEQNMLDCLHTFKLIYFFQRSSAGCLYVNGLVGEFD